MITLFRKIRQRLVASGSVTKYLFYAIGEILLVVVGILIALQVNNWNEERREQQIAMDVRVSIINDLNRDIAVIEPLRQQFESNMDSYDSLQLKLIDPDVTEVEVVRLIRDEYSPYHTDFEGFNDNSYRAAQSSGSINFLTKTERAGLYEMYTKQLDVMRIADTYERLYLDAISEFNTFYPLQIPFIAFKSGPVFERKWSNADFDDLTSKFNNAGSSKRNYYRIMDEAMNEVNGLSRVTIEILEANL